MQYWPFLACVLAMLDTLLSAPSPKLSLVDWTNYFHHEPSGPGSYAFGYDIDDAGNNNVQFRNEERFPNGTVIGSYGYVAPDGNVRIVHYIADQNGYRANEENAFNLSLLKPIRYPDTPFFHPQGSQGKSTLYNPKPPSEHPGNRFYLNHV